MYLCFWLKRNKNKKNHDFIFWMSCNTVLMTIKTLYVEAENKIETEQLLL